MTCTRIIEHQLHLSVRFSEQLFISMHCLDTVG